MSNFDLWTFKHEPKKLDQMALDPVLKRKLNKVIKDVPNLILYGKPGVGKGTFTHILLKETGYDHMWINASDQTGIDTIRDQVKSFATSMGITTVKIVVLNEADSLTSSAQGSQKILRQLMEDVHNITRFILLANYESNLIPELKSRCQVIEMLPAPGTEIMALCERILKSERIQYNKANVVSIIKKCHPDIRKIIFTLQQNTEDGVLTSDMISRSEEVYSNILTAIISKDPEKVRGIL